MSYLLTLILTIFIEIVSVLIIGLKNKELLTNILLVNILTNPTLNFILEHTYFNFENILWLYIILLELIVVIFEWLFLKFRLKSKNLPFFKIAFIINATSFLIGLLISEIYNGVLVQ